jgi:protein O-mannosyl-transferase
MSHDGPMSTPEKPPSANSNIRGKVTGISLLLVAAVFLVFGQTWRHEFINYDDDVYVAANPHVTQGLTPAGLVWAFTYSEIGHWHPLTWLSHMLDCQLWGLNAGGHHLTNVLFHAANAVLLFLLLRRLMGLRSNKSIGATTPPAGTLWGSAFVAAMFAIHPLRVESVAWVSERKDVLSAFFFLLTLLMYARYVEQSRAQSPKFKIAYGFMLLFFTLGLLSKNMLVTLPFVLLLLDYWPLNRFERSTLWPLLREKLPLLVLAAASCAATGLASETIRPVEKLPALVRLENAPVSYVTYLWQMVWPAGLAIPYPAPANSLSLAKVAAAVSLLIAVSLGAFVFRKKHPYFLIGWLWYCGMLVPVSGLVQISYYAHADRYTYLPQIGLYIIIAWAAKDLTAGWRHRRQLLGAMAFSVIAALLICAWKQTSYWRNDESLWGHTLACTSGNFMAYNNLANAMASRNRFDEAMAYYQQSIQISPGYAYAHNNLANVLFAQGRSNEAIEHYRKAVELIPDYMKAHYNLGVVLSKQGKLDEALAHYQKALALEPDYAEAHYNLGCVFDQQGKTEAAIQQYQQAIQCKPGYAEAHYHLALVSARAR